MIIMIITLKKRTKDNDNDNIQAAYLRTQAAPRAPQYLQPPPSFALTQGKAMMIMMMIMMNMVIMMMMTALVQFPNFV